MVCASGDDSAALSEERKAWSPIDGAGEHAPHPQGKDIFTNGLPAQGTPACAICHGADGADSATFPRIVGQHADYMYKQIRVFKDTNDRPRGVVMKGIAHALTPVQIKAVTTYVSTL